MDPRDPATHAGRWLGRDTPRCNRAAPVRNQDHLPGPARCADRLAEPNTVPGTAGTRFCENAPGRSPRGCLMLDLDRFKEVNDTLGHPVGDALLKAVAMRLRECVGETALIARLGGSEFAVVEDIKESIGEAAVLAKRIQKALCEQFDLGDYQVLTGTSIGIAIAPRDGSDADEILRNADLALYRAKSSGRRTHRFFAPEMGRHMRARRALERDIRSALVNGEFELCYQPIVDLKDGEVTGHEALLRWRHRQRGLIMPAEFIPLAE